MLQRLIALAFLLMGAIPSFAQMGVGSGGNVLGGRPVGNLSLCAGANNFLTLNTSTNRIECATPPGAGGGEANTASNMGTGAARLFVGKNGLDLQFRRLRGGSARVTVTENGDYLDIEVVEAAIQLAASQIGSGTFNVARIPDLDAAKVATGTFDAARIPNLDASKVNSGTFNADRIPVLDAAKVGTGTVPLARGGTGQSTWVAGRCVQVSGDGTRLESAAAECGSGGSAPATSGSSATYAKNFIVPATTWTITAAEHGFGSCDFDVVTQTTTLTGVKVVYHSEAECQTASGAGQYDVTVTWETAQAGRALLVVGGGDVEPNIWTPLSGVTTIDVEHNWNTKALVYSVFDSSDRAVEPGGFEHLSANSARITFAVPQSGGVVLNRAGWSGSSVGGGTGGDATVVSNTGAGAQVLKTGTNVTARSIVGGVGISVEQTENAITITNTGAGEGGAGTVATSTGLLGDGSVGDPVRVNPATVPTFLTGSATINDWGTIGAAACVEQTFALAGAVSNDAVIPRWPAALPAGLSGLMRVSGLDTVAVRLCNPTASGVAVANGFQFGVTILRSF